jgi:hypothetical protein
VSGGEACGVPSGSSVDDGLAVGVSLKMGDMAGVGLETGPGLAVGDPRVAVPVAVAVPSEEGELSPSFPQAARATPRANETHARRSIIVIPNLRLFNIFNARQGLGQLADGQRRKK